MQQWLELVNQIVYLNKVKFGTGINQIIWYELLLEKFSNVSHNQYCNKLLTNYIGFIQINIKYNHKITIIVS